MKSRSAWLEDPGKIALLSVLLNALILASLLLVFQPFFETNDDMAIALFVNGARGSHDAHLVYTNYIIGLILSALYRAGSRFPWYTLLQYAALFGSFTAVLYGVLRRLRNLPGLWLSVLVIYFFAYDGYIRLQYTKTAGIVSAAGIFLLLCAAGRGRTAWKSLIFGYVLSCAGFMYREQQFFAELVLMSGIGVFLLLEGTAERGLLKKRFLRCAGIFAALAVMAAGLHLVDRAAYRAQEWQDYLEYNELRTELLDYGFPDYAENEEAYEELGIDRTAYRMYRGWNFLDTEKFTPDVMRSLIGLKTPRTFSLQLLKNFLREVPGRLFARDCFYCFLLIFIFWLLWGDHTRRAAAAVLYEACVTGALYLYLYYTGRYLYNRVDVGIWLAAVLVMLWLYAREDSRRLAGRGIGSGTVGKTDPAGGFSARTGIALLFSVLCLTQNMWRGSWRVNSTDKTQSRLAMRATVDQLHADTEHLYLVKMGTVSFSGSYGPFDVVPQGIAQNILALGGWPSMMPWCCGMMEENSLDNPFRDVVDREDVYLLDQDIDSTLKYIRKYYDKSAEAELAAEYPGCNAYRIVSGNSGT